MSLYPSEIVAHFQNIVFYMKQAKRNPQSAGVVFVLGAGCSMQYGLPGFEELLRWFREDHFSHLDAKGSLNDLRHHLEVPWAGLDVEARRGLLSEYLNHVSGKNCPGYLYLASLMKQGLVRAVINMNFDTLLEDACEAVGFEPIVREQVDPDQVGAIFKIHGSIRKGGGQPVIALGESEFFKSHDQKERLKELLLGHHIVMIGYSGQDQDFRAALSPPTADAGSPRKIFYFNGKPLVDRGLMATLQRRESGDLFVSGRDAGFENVLEGLWSVLQGRSLDKAQATLGGPHGPRRHFFTASEQAALDHCLELALDIRSGINVAEVSRIGVDEHASEIFGLCLDLARCSGIALTSPEKFLLYCVSILHDLGYFLGYSQGEIARSRGWSFLMGHGEMTARLLEETFNEQPVELERLYPDSYDPEHRELFRQFVVDLCYCHTCSVPFGGGDPRYEPGGTTLFRVLGFDIPVRFSLLHALFSAVEEISLGHPFLPTTDPVGVRSGRGSSAIEDPVLDLYLRRKEEVVRFGIHRDEVVVDCHSDKGKESPAYELLSAMARDAVEHYGRIADSYGGRTMRFVDPAEGANEAVASGESPRVDYPKGIERALEELLVESLAETPEGLECYASVVQDLVAIFCLRREEAPTRKFGPRSAAQKTWKLEVVRHRGLDPEPRVDLETSKEVRLALAKVEDSRPSPRRPLLASYLRIQTQLTHRTRMESEFAEFYEAVLYPAWRFCARKWREGLDAINMARMSLDFGSSRYRGEVSRGLRHLFDDKIFWSNGGGEGQDGESDVASGHSGCTLCTGRLLYILAHARLLHTAEEMNRLSFGWRGKNLNELTSALLGYFLRRDLEQDSWWGTEDRTIESADYIAWAIRSLVFVLEVDHCVTQGPGQRSWLADCNQRRDEVEALLAGLWQKLTRSSVRDIMSTKAEEPHSHIVGEMAMACHAVLDAAGRGSVAIETDAVDRLVATSLLAYRDLRQPKLSRLSQLYTLPLATLVSRRAVDSSDEIMSYLASILAAPGTSPWKDEPSQADVAETIAAFSDIRREIVRLCADNAKSPVWIRKGEDAGSWGYNNENTQRIASCLSAGWRHLLDHPGLFEPLWAERDDG